MQTTVYMRYVHWFTQGLYIAKPPVSKSKVPTFVVPGRVDGLTPVTSIISVSHHRLPWAFSTVSVRNLRPLICTHCILET